MLDHVVFFSGGVASWATAKRVAATHGTQRLKLLFTDTLIEDPTLYTFLKEGAINVGGELITITEGRTPWQVFRDERMLGNSRVDPCSRVLKREPAQRWIKSTYPRPESVRLYLGLSWDEQHRLERSQRFWQPYAVWSPLCEPPYLQKNDLFAWAKSEGLTIPRLYELGFSHNNCGGGCVKAGVSHFRHLLHVLPDVYDEWATNEEAIPRHLNKPVTILRYQQNNERHNITLNELRDKQADLTPAFDWGGCGCFSPEDDEITDDDQ